MKRFGLFFALLLMPVLLAGCSRWLEVAIFNNTDDAIEVSAGRDSAVVAPSRYSQIDYPRPDRDPVIHLVRIVSGGCEYLYDVPWPPHGYPGPLDTNYRGIQVQVEKDFSIDLVPGSYKGDTPVSSDAVLQQDGFPLHPIARKCDQRQG